MGNTCARCVTLHEEKSLEINDDAERRDTNPQKTETPLPFNSQLNKKKSKKRNPADEIASVVRLQALVKGFITRRKYRVKHLPTKTNKYFQPAESKETLTGIFKDTAKIEQRTHTYTTGAIYAGQWRGGMRHGQGNMMWADGAQYEGEWSFNAANGQGKFEDAYGDVYRGSWKNNKPDGHGVYYDKKGSRYEGGWLQDQQHGKGKETWQEGASYQGDYVFSKKEGKGKYTWADGSTYDGDWVDNKIKGVGTYLWKDGRKCYGEWLDNDMSGYGIFIYADGVRYEGQFLLDKKEGFGIYKWTDGRNYEGWWHKGKQHGLGQYYDPIKKTLKFGLWENGKRVRWYDEPQQKEITARTFDYRKDFMEPASAKALPNLVTFQKPGEYDKKIKEIKQRLNVV